jgi:hypothetical protein
MKKIITVLSVLIILAVAHPVYSMTVAAGAGLQDFVTLFFLGAGMLSLGMLNRRLAAHHSQSTPEPDPRAAR